MTKENTKGRSALRETKVLLGKSERHTLKNVPKRYCCPSRKVDTHNQQGVEFLQDINTTERSK